ncbi:MAG TPA: DNA methyltransferase [Ktedonobacteraceae bacterium]|nr:DNA methyltransferase [Ktedonobacteraceae bacterium]
MTRQPAYGYKKIPSTPSAHAEQVTQRFYAQFRIERFPFLRSIQGIEQAEERERFASLLLNRLMFVYFLQHKGFLDDDRDYCSTRLCLTQISHGLNTFYSHFLCPLFYQGLGGPERSRDLEWLLGTVPYLGGRLFSPHEVERRNLDIHIPDAAFERIFAFFDRYRWSPNEQPGQADNQITPNMLGYIFEQHINQQHMGAYYTKEDITAYIAKNTIIPFLFDTMAKLCPATFGAEGTIWQIIGRDPDRYIYQAVRSDAVLPGETIADYQARRARYLALHETLASGTIRAIDDFITYNLDICQFAREVICAIEDPELLQAFYERLQGMTILDPTCGSGAFLFGALSVLEPLYAACIERMKQAMGRDGQAQGPLSSASLPLAPTTAHAAPLDQGITGIGGRPGNKSDAINRVGTTVEAGGQHVNHGYFILKSIISNNLYGVDIMEEASEICRLRLSLKLLAQVELAEEIEPLPPIERHIRTGNALVGSIVGSGATADRVLTNRCDVVPGAPHAFEQQGGAGQPLDWELAFAEVIGQGGFHVIIGNPPYVEYSAKVFPYVLEGYETVACGNLYPCVVERSYQLLSPLGRQGMILPLAAFATRNMIPLIENFRRWFATGWLSFYHFRPAMLFSGSKFASIPTTIYLTKREGSGQFYSTSLLKWTSEQREQLFSTLSYCRITASRDPANRHYYPKFGYALENSLLEKILKHQTVSCYLSQIPNQNQMFYRSAGGLYWKVFTNFAWPYQTTSNKQCSFQESYERDVFVALFNSSLFWWYYTVTFDTFNLKNYMIFGFRFSYPEDPGIVRALCAHCQRLMDDFRQHARHLKRSKTDSYTVYARKSKAIIDDIDAILAHHYGFTCDELAFIINYDLKYRMGQES